MSKASQRQEAERIKRLAKKKPKAGRVLDTIFYAMPRAANEPLNVWKAVAAWGDKRRKRQDDSDVLSSVMDEAALVAERVDVAKFAADLQRLRIDVQRLQARVRDHRAAAQYEALITHEFPLPDVTGALVG